MTAVDEFYNKLTPFYDILYSDWSASVAKQGAQLASVIQEFLPSSALNVPVEDPAQVRVLDAACGIGTQALGLAALGYDVSGRDISSAAIERATKEAAARKLPTRFSVADLRRLSLYLPDAQPVHVVLACDNVLPHFLSDAEILDALFELRASLVPGGIAIISLRDYEKEAACGALAGAGAGPVALPHGVRQQGSTRYITLQVRETLEVEGERPAPNGVGGVYTLSMYVLEDRGRDEVRAHVMRTRYYAVSTGRMAGLLVQAGFQGVKRIDDRFFQPLLLGRNPPPPPDQPRSSLWHL